MAIGTITKPAGTAFPKVAVEAKLRDALLDTVKSAAGLHGIALPTSQAGHYAASIAIDSLNVVELLCDVEPIVGFQLKDSIVKSGGYSSIDEAISHVMPRIEAAWQKHSGKGAKK
jgi:hypothetical protein